MESAWKGWVRSARAAKFQAERWARRAAARWGGGEGNGECWAEGVCEGGAVFRAAEEAVREGDLPFLGCIVGEGDEIVEDFVVRKKGTGAGTGTGTGTEREKEVGAERPLLLGSLTKPIVAVAVLRLVEEGKVRLDSPVSEQLPEGEWDDASVRVEGDSQSRVPPLPRLTPRHLLTHVGGLHPYFAGKGPPQDDAFLTFPAVESKQEMLRLLRETPLTHAPGSAFRYCFGFELLLALVEAASGEEAGSFLKRTIFDPLGMRSAGFGKNLPRRGRAAAFAALPLREGEAPRSRRFARLPDFPIGDDFPMGWGNLFASPRDYARFAMCIANGGELGGKRILKEETMRDATKDQLEGKGMRVLSMPGVSYGPAFCLIGAVAPEEGMEEGELPAGPDTPAGTISWGSGNSLFFAADPSSRRSVVLFANAWGAPQRFRSSVSRAALCEVGR